MSVTGERTFVPAGSIAVASGTAVLKTVGLGSCVAVVIDDPVAMVGGLSHIVLPGDRRGRGSGQPGRYASSAVPLLVEQVLAGGGRRSRLRARLVGGATMFPELQSPGVPSLGMRNAAAARELLQGLGIPVEGEETGGHHGRSVAFYPQTGRVEVRSARAAEVVL